MCLASSKHINGGRLRINRVLKIYSVTCLKTGRPTIDSLTNFAIKVVKSCSVLSHNTTFCHCKTLCLYCASTVVRFRFRIDLINSTPQKTKTKQDKTRRNSCCTVIFAPPSTHRAAGYERAALPLSATSPVLVYTILWRTSIA